MGRSAPGCDWATASSRAFASVQSLFSGDRARVSRMHRNGSERIHSSISATPGAIDDLRTDIGHAGITQL